MDVRGKVALVTGASRGVGRATAVLLARRGCHVAINYRRSQQQAQSVLEEVQSLDVQAQLVQADVSVPEQAQGLVRQVAEHFGRLDVLVNNAGTTHFIRFGDLGRVTPSVWQEILNTNLLGPFYCTQAAAEVMRQTAGPEGAEVVNVASVAGLLPTGSSLPYATSKAALIHLTRCLARALAPRVRVNAVAPGFIEGQWLREGLGRHYEPVKEAFEEQLPLGRVCQPEDVAQAIVGLITGSDLVTGTVLPVESGMLVLDPINFASRPRRRLRRETNG